MNNQGSSNHLLSRDVLTRGVDSFRDPGGYYINENDLLDLEPVTSNGYPDDDSAYLTLGKPVGNEVLLSSSVPAQPIVTQASSSYIDTAGIGGGGNFVNSPPPPMPSSNAHMLSPTLENATVNENGKLNVSYNGVQVSTSPFNDFMINQSIQQQANFNAAASKQPQWPQQPQLQLQQQSLPQSQIQQQKQPQPAVSQQNAQKIQQVHRSSFQQAQARQSGLNFTPVYSPTSSSLHTYGMTQIASPSMVNDLRSGNFSPPHALRFLQDHGIRSNTSSPVGSLGDNYSMSPPPKPSPIKLQNKLATGGHLKAQSLDEKQQQMILAERRRRRRESHNAVERRRRDNLNERIQELATLVPDSLLYQVDNLQSPSSHQTTFTKDGKPNKGTILAKSVEYIRHLQGVIDDQNRREMELQDMIQALERQLGVEVTQFTHTSAELALAKIRGADVTVPGSGVGEFDLGDDEYNVLSPDSQSGAVVTPGGASSSGLVGTDAGLTGSETGSNNNKNKTNSNAGYDYGVPYSPS